ncbi:MAG: type II toxin-antitoxin system Phd/YefM family antitoxin [bacterium]
MDINFAEDIMSITELKQKSGTLMKQIKSTGRPIVLTINGRAEAVLLSAKEYQNIRNAMKLMKDISFAEKEIKSQKFISAESYFREFKSAKKI